MLVIFEEEVKNLLRQVGKEDLKPVPSLKNAKKFRHFNVLRKKKSALSLFWEQPDIPAEFSLLDILDPSSPVPEPSVEGPFIYREKMVSKTMGDVAIDSGTKAQVAASGENSESHESFLKFQINEIPTETLTKIRLRKLLEPEPWFLQQCRKRRENLYVVTETVEVINSPELLVENSVKWLGKFSIPRNPYVKAQGQVHGDKEKHQSLTLPGRVVMAYQTKQLVFDMNGWDFVFFKDRKQKTFLEEKLRSLQYVSGEILPIYYTIEILPIQRIEEPASQDFKKLQKEISGTMEALSQFSKDVQDALFHNIFAMLGDRGALQDLQDMMEEFPQGNLDGPGGIILNKLRKDSENGWNHPRYCLLYLLETLMVLNDTQHDQLAWSMEKKILLHQRELIRSILEPNFKYPWRIPFTVKPELLTPLQDEGVDVTYDLLEECGLNVDRNSNRSAWDLEAKMPLSALYGCISLLQQLAEACLLPEQGLGELVSSCGEGATLMCCDVLGEFQEPCPLLSVFPSRD